MTGLVTWLRLITSASFTLHASATSPDIVSFSSNCFSSGIFLPSKSTAISISECGPIFPRAAEPKRYPTTTPCFSIIFAIFFLSTSIMYILYHKKGLCASTFELFREFESGENIQTFLLEIAEWLVVGRWSFCTPHTHRQEAGWG